MNRYLPGRELDALVAEKVMGWHKPTKAEWAADFTVIPLTLWQYQQLTFEHYSTDIADAWKVVGYFTARHFEIDISIYPKMFNDTSDSNVNVHMLGRASARIRARYHRNTIGASTGETMPHALSLAALNAIEHLEIH